MAPQFEQFGEQGAQSAAGLQFILGAGTPPVRLRVRNADNDRMIQIQNGRLVFNWLGHEGKAYPSYTKVKPGFFQALATLREFLAEEALGELRPNQWEIAYVNHFPKGELWQSPSDWSAVIPSLAPPRVPEQIADFENVRSEWSYVIPPARGRLHLSVTQGLQSTPARGEVLILNLTARGPIQASDGADGAVDAGLELGHETLLRAFVSLTSEKAHAHWGLIHDQT